MPLSDEEERVFAQIERQLASEEPPRRVIGTVTPSANRALVGPGVLALLSLIVTVVGVGAHISIGVVGFVAFFAAILNLVRTLFGSIVEDD